MCALTALPNESKKLVFFGADIINAQNCTSKKKEREETKNNGDDALYEKKRE